MCISRGIVLALLVAVTRWFCSAAATALFGVLPAVAFAGTPATPMRVSVTVARSCSLDTAGLVSGSVLLTCSAGASPAVRLGNASTVTPLSAGANRLTVPTVDSTPATGDVRALTINF